MNCSDVLAVVVAFEGEGKIVNTVKKLKECGLKILIVDNGSGQATQEILKNLDCGEVKVKYLRENFGIGYALNVGVRYATDNGFKWILTMDQDSLVKWDLMSAYGGFIKANPSVNSIVPSIVINGESTNYLTPKEVEYAITSGHLLKVELFEKIGFYNEKLFIDGVDFDFCLRLRRAGERTYIVPQAIIFHELGTPHNKKGFLAKWYANHSPVRRYYIFRNYYYLMRLYAFIFPKFAIKFSISHFMLLMGIIKYEENCMENLRYILKGSIDAFFSRYGKYEVSK